MKHSRIITGWVFLLSILTFSSQGIENPFSFSIRGDNNQIEMAIQDKIIFQSPPEGLWSIAMDWKEDWPTDWYHAVPSSRETSGEWTILKGEIKTPIGSWMLSDAYRLVDRKVQCVRRFEWKGDQPAPRCTLSVRFLSSGNGKGVLLPGILYYGNPSGEKSNKVPIYHGQPGEEAIFEEHRFPMPFASLEWEEKDARYGAALHTVPCPVPFGNLPDQWWSIGVIAQEKGTEFTLLSGPCASNGQHSVIKARQPGFLPYPDAWLNVPPGAIIEKTFYLEAFSVEHEGSGFQHPLETSLQLFHPYSLDGLPTFREIITDKYKFAQTRWLENNGAAGFKKFPDRNFFVIGWCGQAAAPGYALQVLQPFLHGSTIPDKVQRSLDFLSTAQFFEGGFHTWYDTDKQEWSGNEPLSQGQGMLNIARAIQAGKKNSYDTSKWEAFLRKASDFHARRILNEDWHPRSTDEAFFIAPLCYAFRTFHDPLYREAAEKAGRHYAERHLTMREPYWGGTLDASCEDKEGAFAALQGFLELYETTQEPDYLQWAKHACDVTLSYTVIWDIDLPPGRLRDHNFKTRGWTVVSPQNQHIDVYGVLIAPDIYRMGVLLQRDDLKLLAQVMYRSCGQLIDPYGSQGEQPQHTNYTQKGEVTRLEGLRGGYNETWTVFWITAHFLNAAALFQELGVPIWE